MNGKQVRLFLVDGTVGSLMTAEILNWTGHMLRARRKDLGHLKIRDEAKRTGVYVLFGSDEDGEPAAYIGEGDNVVKRLENHNSTKDFWEDVVIITSKDMNLTKAHVRYVESELISLAKIIGRVNLHNGNVPSGGAALPEADESEQIRILMPVLGFDIFRGRSSQNVSLANSPTSDAGNSTKNEPSVPDAVSESSDSPIFVMNTREGAKAQAQIIDGEFTVLAGSIILDSMKDNPEMAESTRKSFVIRNAQHAKLLEVAERGPLSGMVTLLKDVAFTSPSAAGAIVYGRASANGRLTWKTEQGDKTLGEWEKDQAN